MTSPEQLFADNKDDVGQCYHQPVLLARPVKRGQIVMMDEFPFVCPHKVQADGWFVRMRMIEHGSDKFIDDESFCAGMDILSPEEVASLPAVPWEDDPQLENHMMALYCAKAELIEQDEPMDFVTLKADLVLETLSGNAGDILLRGRDDDDVFYAVVPALRFDADFALVT